MIFTNNLTTNQTRYLVDFLKCQSDSYFEAKALEKVYNDKIAKDTLPKIPYDFFINDLINQKYVIVSKDKEGVLFRYYPLTFSEEYLMETLNIKENSKISIKTLFGEHLQQMEEFDIREEFELYDLLKKNIDFKKHNLEINKPTINNEPGTIYVCQNIFRMN